MGVAMAKPKVLLVGGMDYNVPPQLKDHFDVVRHITQGGKFQSLPKADYVFVITEWAGHNLVENVKAKTDAPFIPLARGGWEAIKQDLKRRSILPPEEEPGAPPPAVPAKPEVSCDSLFASMTETEVWKKYGPAIIEAAKGALRPKEVVSEGDMLEALSMSGVPKEDCRVYLPKLQMKGILDPVSDGKWRLMAASGVDFENDRVKVDSEFEAEVKAGLESASNKTSFQKNGSYGTDQSTGRRQVRSPELLAMIGGLHKGPYASKRAIFHEMRKYSTFDGLSDWQVEKYILRAIESKIVDDTKAQFYINQDPKVVLTRAKEKILEPEIPVEKAAPAPLEKMVQDHNDKVSGKIDKTDVEKAWCYVVEGVKKEKDRLGSLLSHCRIEWMGDNKVLVVFIPAALAQFQKFVESTENWGVVNRMIQERISKDTVIRFMVDNGLRA